MSSSQLRGIVSENSSIKLTLLSKPNRKESNESNILPVQPICNERASKPIMQKVELPSGYDSRLAGIDTTNIFIQKERDYVLTLLLFSVFT